MIRRDGQLDCLDDDRWLEIAAGMEKPEVAVPALAHASGCNICGPRLREAILLLGDQGEPAEQAFVTELGSSQPGWQQNMAERLALQDRVRVKPEVKVNRFTLGWRFAGACAAILVLLVIPFFFRRESHIASAPASVAVTPVGKSQAAKPPAQIPEPAAKSVPKAEPLFASITLDPNLQRGLDAIPVLHLSSHIKSVLVTLLFLDPPPAQLHIELKNSSSRNIWSQDRNVTEEQVEKRELKATIPAALLSPEDYRIVATSSNQTVATYDYRVETP